MSEIRAVRTPALGDMSYVLVSGDEAALVDPQRDLWPVLDDLRRRRISVTHVFETHVHNDYVSGAHEVAAATGARIAGPARAGYEFAHVPLEDGDEVVVGDVLVRALETPGHTPEHTAYLVLGDDVTPEAIFTGGSLLVGTAGRTDLAGDALTRRLAGQQFRSLRRIALLPDRTAVLPTHGAGSFCGTTGSAAVAASTGSTVGAERRANPALLAWNEEEFARQQLSALRPHPAYYRHMAPINRAGAPVRGGLPPLPALTVDDTVRAVAEGAWVVDGRDRWSFAAGHLPGSVNVELDATFASYVGWVVPFGVPLVLVLPGGTADSGDAAEEAVRQLWRIGWDGVRGRLSGGVDAWTAAGLPLRSFPAVDAAALVAGADGVQVLDVRERGEVAVGAIPGSMHVFVGDLPSRIGDLPRGQEMWAVCASGHRAAIAASLLDRAHVPVTSVARGGVGDWLAGAGEPG